MAIKKSLHQNREQVINIFLFDIIKGKPNGKPVDGNWLSQLSKNLGKRCHMTANQASHFVKTYMLEKNIGGLVVKRGKTGSNGNGYNTYYVEEFNAETGKDN